MLNSLLSPAQYFNPRKWASNGPRLLSAALASQCDLSPEEFAKTISLGTGTFLVFNFYKLCPFCY